MAKKGKIADPHAEREARLYENPIPSREFITAHLERRKGPATHPELCEELHLNSDDGIEALRRRLIAMVRDGQLLCSRKGAFGLLDKMDLIRGRVQGHPDGFGFLIPDQGGKDFLLNHRQMRCCFDGDIVLARKGRRDHRGRIEATITEVLERNTVETVGRFHWEGGFGIVHPENKRIAQDILIPPKDVSTSSDGDIVVVEIVEQPEFRKQPIGKVTQVLGAHMAPGMEIEIALREHDLPYQWSPEVEAEITTIADEVEEAQKKKELALSASHIIAISESTKRDIIEFYGISEKLLMN